MAGTDLFDTADTSSEVLAALHQHTDTVAHAEVEQFALAVEWACMHPPESVVKAATTDGSEGELMLAGDGAPLVAEFCIAELALALGKSTVAGRRFLGDALETRYRLPRLWARVSAGEVPVWRARRIAQGTLALPADGAAHVDRHLAHVADKCSFAQLDRTIEKARELYDPDESEKRRLDAAEHRCFDIALGDVAFDGLVSVEGRLDVADALALEAAIATKAHELLTQHPHANLDVRRSMAAGQLGTPGDGTTRELVIYTHHRPHSPLVDVDNTSSFVTVDQLTDWCTVSGTRVTVRPVIDLAEQLHSDSYEPTERQREQAILTNPTCVFPHCGRDARACDLDHIIAYADGGETVTENLAPLCRSHHRLKTHSAWTYTRTGPRAFTWTSPHGYTFHRRG